MNKTIKEIEKEFENLREEKAEFVSNIKGFTKFETPSHGFLVVPRSSLYYNLACKIQSADGYGYAGKLAVYLEEDCQASDFLNRLPKGEPIISQAKQDRIQGGFNSMEEKLAQII